MNKLSGLYLVTPDWDDTEQLLKVTEQALRQGTRILQYRHKTAAPSLRAVQAAALQALCRRYQTLFIINDHLELCQQLDADGLHVGGTDASVAAVRLALGSDKIIGASCYGDLGLARLAWQQGASYVAYGGFFPSRVKKYPVTTPVGIIGESRQQIPLPVAVIGGMTPENSQPLINAGADMVAAISSVYMADDPQKSAQQFVGMFLNVTLPNTNHPEGAR